MTGTPRDFGPHQLADWLDVRRGQVDRARLFGLLPEPDVAGTRWSAAAAKRIRRRWAKTAAETECIGAAGLKARGWTEGMIRDLLGDPDLTVNNPHYKSAATMRLWRLRKAERAEASPKFAARKERAARQSAAAGKAAGTKKLRKALGGT